MPGGYEPKPVFATIFVFIGLVAGVIGIANLNAPLPQASEVTDLTGVPMDVEQSWELTRRETADTVEFTLDGKRFKYNSKGYRCADVVEAVESGEEVVVGIIPDRSEKSDHWKLYRFRFQGMDVVPFELTLEDDAGANQAMYALPLAGAAICFIAAFMGYTGRMA